MVCYYVLVGQYYRLATDKSIGGRTYTRALVALLENFHFSMEDDHANQEHAGPDDSDETQKDGKKQTSTNVKIRDAIIDRLLPAFLKCMEQKDGLEDENRIPVAIGAASIII